MLDCDYAGVDRYCYQLQLSDAAQILGSIGIIVEFQTELTLSKENQNGIPRSKFDPISSLTCSSFCNLTCLTGSGGKVMGVVRLSSHQATLRQVKPNMGIQIMSSNNLWWQDCNNFSHVGFTVWNCCKYLHQDVKCYTWASCMK